MKYLIPSYLISGLVIFLLVSGCSPAPVVTDNNLKFRVLSQGQTSGLTQRKYLTLRTTTEYLEFWNVHANFNTTPPPKVDFTNEMVIATFMGEQRTGGYAITIEKIIEQEKTIQVYVALTRPKPGSNRIMMITQPHMIVALPLSKKPVTLQFRTTH